jgi:hypothetical protein
MHFQLVPSAKQQLLQHVLVEHVAQPQQHDHVVAPQLMQPLKQLLKQSKLLPLR